MMTEETRVDPATHSAEQGGETRSEIGLASRRTVVKAALAGAAGVAGGMMSGAAAAQDTATPVAATPGANGPGRPGQYPNIVVIMADDIGYWNTSAYNMGMMGYRVSHPEH
jgi:arylsulfatase